MLGNGVVKQIGDAMKEQSQLDDLFRQLWRDIDNAVKTNDKHDYEIIKDAAKDKGRQIMETVAMVISERDDLLQRIQNIREIVR